MEVYTVYTISTLIHSTYVFMITRPPIFHTQPDSQRSMFFKEGERTLEPRIQVNLLCDLLIYSVKAVITEKARLPGEHRGAPSKLNQTGFLPPRLPADPPPPPPRTTE